MKLIFWVLSFLFSVNASAQMCSDVFADGPNPTETFSQFIRSHPQEFFSFLDGFSRQRPQMARISETQGWISGDSHPGQWTLVPNQGRFVYTLADFDMAGKGPLIIDFMQYALNVKAIIHQSPSSRQNIRIKEMLEAYLSGLKGEATRAPSWIRQILQKSQKDFSQKEQSYYAKKISRKNMKLKVEEGLAKIDNLAERNQILATLDASSFFANYDIRDIIQKKIERGGSAGQKRYWVLATDKNRSSELKIFELKEKQYGILNEAQNSSDPMYQYYWNNDLHPDYFSVTINQVEFDVRPKKVAFQEADIPYKLKSDQDWNFLADKARYDLHLMGLKHAQQLQSRDYALQIESQSSAVTRLTKEFIESYIEQFGQN